MTTRSTTYAKAAAGKLEIVFTGSFDISVSGDAGFPTTGNANMTVECVVSNAGGELAKAYLNRSSPSAHVLLDYPGGSESWTVTMSNVSQTYGGGLGNISVVPKVSFILVKK